MRPAVLSCLVAISALTSPAYAQERIQDFYFVVSKDEFDDSDRSFVYTPALSADDTRSGARLLWRCLEDGLNVIYRYDKYLAGDSDEELRVRYRVDDLAATDFAYWGMMTDNKATWMPMQRIQDFTATAMRGMKLVIEAEDPADSERVRDSFSLRGLGAALDYLKCR
jgi:hypothetical protein